MKEESAALGYDDLKNEKVKNKVAAGAAALGYDYLKNEEMQNKVAAGAAGFVDDAKLLWLMIKDYRSGNYTAIPTVVIAVAAGALIYLVSPDLLPGPLDDAIVLSAAMAAITEDVKKYKAWKEANEKAVLVTVELETGKSFTLDGDEVPLHISDRLKEIAEGCGRETVNTK